MIEQIKADALFFQDHYLSEPGAAAHRDINRTPRALWAMSLHGPIATDTVSQQSRLVVPIVLLNLPKATKEPHAVRGELLRSPPDQSARSTAAE